MTEVRLARNDNRWTRLRWFFKKRGGSFQNPSEISAKILGRSLYLGRLTGGNHDGNAGQEAKGFFRRRAVRPDPNQEERECRAKR
ncbi:MAG: hypothetical protein DVB23_003451, partial [Verrucomicrobia bacterium]